MSRKHGYAKYTFAFASDIQNLADEKQVKIANFNVQRRKNRIGSYDYLTVNFIVPRPDRDNKPDVETIGDTPNRWRLEQFIKQLEDELDESPSESGKR